MLPPARPLHRAVAARPRVVDKLLVPVAIMAVRDCNRGMVGAYRQVCWYVFSGFISLLTYFHFQSLIDLAGSEKATSDKERTREGKYINTRYISMQFVITFIDNWSSVFLPSVLSSVNSLIMPPNRRSTPFTLTLPNSANPTITIVTTFPSATPNSPGFSNPLSQGTPV